MMKIANRRATTLPNLLGLIVGLRIVIKVSFRLNMCRVISGSTSIKFSGSFK